MRTSETYPTMAANVYLRLENLKNFLKTEDFIRIKELEIFIDGIIDAYEERIEELNNEIRILKEEE